MGVYSRDIGPSEIEYSVANAGTYLFSGESWKQNVLQLFGKSVDMEESIAYASEFVKSKLGVEVTFVSHSKGGAEAAANAVATNRNAFVFNAASVNLKAYGLDAADYTANMTAFIVRNEVLHNNFKAISKPIGKLVYLPSQSFSPIINHLMSSVKKGLE